MTEPHVGFYVHYHGLGHKHRTESILQHLSLPASVITSRIDTLQWTGPRLEKVLGIACDIDDVPEGGGLRSGEVSTLHYAPLWTGNCTQRVAEYTAWLNQTRPAVMIVDVSVEISLLTRMASIPQIVMRQHGDRSDLPHIAAYEAAEVLLAPYPEWMEDDITPDWVREKTRYLHGFCRQQPLQQSRAEARKQLNLPERPLIVAMLGRGGALNAIEHLSQAAAATPDYEWLVVGLSQDDANHAGVDAGNLRLAGWIDDPSLHLRAADIVVTAAGHNSVMETGFHGCRMVAVAQERPFDEQLRKTIVLDREGLAVGLSQWPEPQRWPEILDRAQRLDPAKWEKVFEQDGARQAAEVIEQVAMNSKQETDKQRQPSLADSTEVEESLR